MRWEKNQATPVWISPGCVVKAELVLHTISRTKLEKNVINLTYSKEPRPLILYFALSRSLSRAAEPLQDDIPAFSNPFPAPPVVRLRLHGRLCASDDRLRRLR